MRFNMITSIPLSGELHVNVERDVEVTLTRKSHGAIAFR
jgi:hypothetical protein